MAEMGRERTKKAVYQTFIHTKTLIRVLAG